MSQRSRKADVAAHKSQYKSRCERGMMRQVGCHLLWAATSAAASVSINFPRQLLLTANGGALRYPVGIRGGDHVVPVPFRAASIPIHKQLLQASPAPGIKVLRDKVLRQLARQAGNIPAKCVFQSSCMRDGNSLSAKCTSLIVATRLFLRLHYSRGPRGPHGAA